MAKVVVTGVKEIDAKFKKLGAKTSNQIARKATKVGAKPIESEARSAAPVQSGQLRKNIKTRAAKKSRTSMGTDVSTSSKGWKGKSFYGAYQEYGWQPSTKRGGKKILLGPRKEGQHFLEKAYKSKGDSARRIAIDEILKGIEREAST